MTETLVSDLGNVLLLFDNNIFIERLARVASRPAAEVRKAAHDNP